MKGKGLMRCLPERGKKRNWQRRTAYRLSPANHFWLKGRVSLSIQRQDALNGSCKWTNSPTNNTLLQKTPPRNLLMTESYKKKNRQKYAIAERARSWVNKVRDILVILVLRHRRCRGTKTMTDTQSQTHCLLEHHHGVIALKQRCPGQVQIKT